MLIGGILGLFAVLALIGREMYRARHRQPAQTVPADAKLPPAIREMLIALRADPSNVELNRNMAARLEAMRAREAIQFRRKVVELQPDSVEDHLALANTAIRLGDAAGALQSVTVGIFGD